MKHEQVQDYYGRILQSSDDLQTNACCTDDEMPGWLKRTVANVHDDVLSRYYGCGLVAPEQLEGLRILDLGCGAGRDVYVLAQLVGEVFTEFRWITYKAPSAPMDACKGQQRQLPSISRSSRLGADHVAPSSCDTAM